MENSKGYKELIQQMNANGSKKMDGYYPRLMEEIYEWEREEVEDIIWETFVNQNDSDLAIFLPKLKKYKGIDALKSKLDTYDIPSGGSVKISQVLYEATKDNKYLDTIKQNIDLEPNKISNVAILSYCKPCKKTYELLVDIYINSENEVVRSTAVTGILYNREIIKNPLDLQEMMMNLELERKFDLDDITERKKIMIMFENGQL